MNKKHIDEYELLVEKTEKDYKKRNVIFIIICFLILLICLLGTFFSFKSYRLNISGKKVIYKEADINKWFMINIDLNNDGICDINCDVDGDNKPDYNIDYLGSRSKTFNKDTNNDKKADENYINIDSNKDGMCDLNCDNDNNGWPDFKIDINGDGKCDINCDNNNDGICDLNCDVNLDNNCDAFCDTNNDNKCEKYCNIDLTCKSNCISNDKGECILNCDLNVDGKCDKNCDTNNDGIADNKIDINNDDNCDINCVEGEKGYCYLNCDTNNDGKCEMNCDNNNDGVCDYNCDTDGDNKCDFMCDINGDKICDYNCYLKYYLKDIVSIDYSYHTPVINVIFDDTNIVTMNNLFPGDDIPLKKFKVINSGNVSVKYDLYWANVKNDFSLENNLHYNVFKGNYLIINNYRAPYSSNRFLRGIIINPGETHEYSIKMIFQETHTNQNVDQGKEFSSKIEAIIYSMSN